MWEKGRKHPSERQQWWIPLHESAGDENPEMDRKLIQLLWTFRGLQQRCGNIHGESAVVVLCRTKPKLWGFHDRNLS